MKVLVVDDMAVFREPIAAALRHHGFETVCAADGREALEVALAQPPDLILLDVAMPEMDGLEFLEHARAAAQLRHVPVILLTAVTERDYILKARALGAQGYMLKSQFSLKELIERVHKFLDGAPAAPKPALSALSPDAEAGGAPLPSRPRPRRLVEDVDAAMQDLLTEPEPGAPPEDSASAFEADLTASGIFAQLEASEELKSLLDAPRRD